jgi:predicted Holliday junction resolvase-like endonuclease
MIVIILLVYSLYLSRKGGLIKREINLKVEKELLRVKDHLRKETLNRSRAVLKGRIAEQIVPFLADFKYNPSDARFIGSPVDYVIFDGYTDVKDRRIDRPITVILADIKTGKITELTSGQKRIKKAIEQKRVKWETIRLKE